MNDSVSEAGIRGLMLQEDIQPFCKTRFFFFILKLVSPQDIYRICNSLCEQYIIMIYILFSCLNHQCMQFLFTVYSLTSRFSIIGLEYNV